MQINRRHSDLARTLLCLAVLMLITVACERKPLYLRVGTAEIAVNIDLNMEIVWGIEWKTEWQYKWNVVEYGTIGYTLPDWVRATIYDVDPQTCERTGSFVQNFTLEGGRVALSPGSWYDILFYNAGTEYIIFDTDESHTYYTATTRTGDTKVISRSKASLADSTAVAKHYVDYKQPDELVGVLTDTLYISENMDDYDSYLDEDGNVTYIYKIKAELEPYSFIYLFQIMLINNYDSVGARVTMGSGMTVTGLSQGVDLYTRQTWDNTISISLDDIKATQTSQMLHLPDSTWAYGDIFAARMVTWGLPGIKPLEEAINPFRMETEYPDDNFVNLSLRLRNGNEYIVSYDITDQMRDKPSGGVITIVVDATEEIPDEEVDKKKETSGGGFSADVDPWENEYDAEITI